MALFKIEEATMKPTSLKYYAAVPDSVGAREITAASPINGEKIAARAVPKPIKSKGIIDVYRTFDWTTSPINNADFDATAKTPFAKLTEYRMDDASIINSMLYYVQAFGDQIGTVANIAAPNAVDGIRNLTSTVRSAVLGVAGKDVNNFEKLSDNPWLKPYDGLYSLTPTAFEYYLPYFENDAFNRIESSYKDMTSPGLDGFRKGAEGTMGFGKLIAPGQYIEAPQMFALSDANAPQIDIKFPLLNTLSFEGAVKNYQLLWLLAFQNTPQRVTKSVVEMPRMYDVRIPGVTFMKYAYIQSMKVDFIGVRRRVTIPMPACPKNPPEAEVIMPDAYQVTITLKSTIMNANNMMLENWRDQTPLQ